MVAGGLKELRHRLAAPDSLGGAKLLPEDGADPVDALLEVGGPRPSPRAHASNRHAGSAWLRGVLIPGGAPRVPLRGTAACQSSCRGATSGSLPCSGATLAALRHCGAPSQRECRNCSRRDWINRLPYQCRSGLWGGCMRAAIAHLSVHALRMPKDRKMVKTSTKEVSHHTRHEYKMHACTRAAWRAWLRHKSQLADRSGHKSNQRPSRLRGLDEVSTRPSLVNVENMESLAWRRNPNEPPSTFDQQIDGVDSCSLLRMSWSNTEAERPCVGLAL